LLDDTAHSLINFLLAEVEGKTNFQNVVIYLIKVVDIVETASVV
jgi:hypothetical protein